MLTITKSQPTGLETYDISLLPKGAWIDLVAPTSTELARVSEMTEVPVDILRAALDEEERSRTELEDNCLLTVLNVPIQTDKFYDTLPLGIILTEDYVITVSLEENDVLQRFNHRTWRFFNTSKKVSNNTKPFVKCPFFTCEIQYFKQGKNGKKISPLRLGNEAAAPQ